jgi:hypothetical protein
VGKAVPAGEEVALAVGEIVFVGVSDTGTVFVTGKRQFPVKVILSKRNVPPLPLAPYPYKRKTALGLSLSPETALRSSDKE